MLSTLSRYIRRKTKPATFMLALSIFCLSHVGMLLLHNKLMDIKPPSDTGEQELHPPLDYRHGYQPADVEFVLSNYGEAGRRIYSYLELLDLSIFMWSYAAVLSMMLSAGAAVAPYEWLKLANLLPWAAAAADAVENTLMLAILATHPSNTAALAPHVATANRVKWQLLLASASTVGGIGFFCLSVAARGRTKQPTAGSSTEQQASPQLRQQRQQRKKQR